MITDCQRCSSGRPSIMIKQHVQPRSSRRSQLADSHPCSSTELLVPVSSSSKVLDSSEPLSRSPTGRSGRPVNVCRTEVRFDGVGTHAEAQAARCVKVWLSHTNGEGMICSQQERPRTRHVLAARATKNDPVTNTLSLIENSPDVKTRGLQSCMLLASC